jgi:Glutathione S-transferase, N-terminal domain
MRRGPVTALSALDSAVGRRSPATTPGYDAVRPPCKKRMRYPLFTVNLSDDPELVVPVLWQLEVSHYNEKVRWALDYKHVPHIRRSLLPGLHALKAKRLTGDTSTTPVLTLDGRSIGDSTRIIAAIEERWRTRRSIRRMRCSCIVHSSSRSSSTRSWDRTSAGSPTRSCFPIRGSWRRCLLTVNRSLRVSCCEPDSHCCA